MKVPVIIGFLLFIFCYDARGQSPDSLSMISFNIHHANPPHQPGVIDVVAVIKVLKNYPADVIALQEVDVNVKRSGSIDQAKMIADSLNRHLFFARAIDYDGGQYGVALLSRFPMSDTQTLYLPVDPGVRSEQRVLATALIILPSGLRVRVGNTHLDHQKDSKIREAQMATIISFAKKQSTEFIVAGDLNAVPGSAVLTAYDGVFQRTCEVCTFTFPAQHPSAVLDFIGFKRSNRIRILAHELIPDTEVSDHLPVRATLLFDLNQ